MVISASSARLSDFSRLANGFRRRVLQALGPPISADCRRC